MKNRLGISGGRRALPILALPAAAFGVGTGLQRLGTAAHAETSAFAVSGSLKLQPWPSKTGRVQLQAETLRPSGIFGTGIPDPALHGRGYDRPDTSQAGGRSPKIDSIIGVRDVIATEYGNHIVVRYVISLKGSADGKTLQSCCAAPRQCSAATMIVGWSLPTPTSPIWKKTDGSFQITTDAMPARPDRHGHGIY